MMSRSHSRPWILKALLVFGALAIFAASCVKQVQRSSVPVTSAETPDPVPGRVSEKTFRAFSHSIPEHTQFACNTCHQREEQGVKSKFEGHESCIGCHMNEWIANEQAICSVCHTDVNSQDPPVKVFPAKFIEKFDMTFNHAKHERITGCSDCHQRSGKGKTIPVGFQAHADCYGCHTAETKLGQCSYCHKLAPHYNRTVQSEYSFGTVKFTHGGRHSDISCTECHRVVPGAENSRQVKNIAILEHRTTPGDNCLKCHNGSRAFNGNNQNDRCERCHNGPKIVYLPSGSYSGAAEEAPAEN